jgi:CRISPR/Cas system type I-B associated protein Csh2 (Cas7 group RAMP superfamily)
MNFSHRNHVFTVESPSMSVSNSGPMMQRYAKYLKELELVTTAAKRYST